MTVSKMPVFNVDCELLLSTHVQAPDPLAAERIIRTAVNEWLRVHPFSHGDVWYPPTIQSVGSSEVKPRERVES